MAFLEACLEASPESSNAVTPEAKLEEDLVACLDASWVYVTCAGMHDMMAESYSNLV